MVRHVLMTAETQSRIWGYSIELARALSGHGIRVSLSTMDAPVNKDQRREAARVPGLAIYEGIFDLKRLEVFPRDLSAAREWLTSLEEKLRPDIVQLNNLDYGPPNFKSPTVVVAHAVDSAHLDGYAGPPSERVREELLAIIGCADVLISPTRSLLDDLKRLVNFNTPARVIPYFQRYTEYRSGAKQKFVFSAGEGSRQTSLSAAIESTAGAYEWGVVTEQNSVDGAKTGAAKRLTLKGLSARTAEQISKAAIFCQPMLAEQSVVSVLEGALSQCALVIGDVPSLRENWNNCALFVPQNNVAILKENLQMLIVDQHLREELGYRAYERAKEFSPERCIDDYLDAYQAAWAHKYRLSK